MALCDGWCVGSLWKVLCGVATQAPVQPSAPATSWHTQVSTQGLFQRLPGVGHAGQCIRMPPHREDLVLSDRRTQVPRTPGQEGPTGAWGSRGRHDRGEEEEAAGEEVAAPDQELSPL